MPPFLIAAAVALAVLLIPKKKGNQLAIVQSTPFNSGTGITTGFAQPAIQSSSVSPAPNATQTNAPSTSGSGVPDYSSQTSEFNTGQPYMQASPGFHSYYHPAQRGLLKPISAMSTRHPQKSVGENCGCGSGKHGVPSNCGASARRNADTGCLAPSKRSQIKNTPPEIFAQWADNISSAGYGMFDALQHSVSQVQSENPMDETNLIPPAGNNTPIGFPIHGFR